MPIFQEKFSQKVQKRLSEIQSKLKKYDHNINLEVFVHGALCYCYSGQCLMSSFLGGRSGNRGLCAQPCRMRYTFKDYYNTLLAEDNYLLSTKDLCTYNNIHDLIDAGANCLKIEGRMKSSEYVSSTTYAYKNALMKRKNYEDYLLFTDILKEFSKFNNFFSLLVFFQNFFCILINNSFF